MSSFTAPNGDSFSMERTMIEATSLHRPDPRWTFIDAQGHIHQWHTDGHRATSYSPTNKYETPSLKWVKDGEAYWPGDDEPHDVGHLECVQCGEHVEPGYCPDETTQYVPGILRCFVNGRSVSREEYAERVKAAFPDVEFPPDWR